MLSAIVITAVLSYLLGSINTSMIVSKIKKRDIRKEGSGNAGATNALRVLGKSAAAIVVLGDALKAFIALGIANITATAFQVTDARLVLIYVAMMAVVIGHDFPLYFGFRGGKGIVTSVAVIFALDWRMGIMVLGTGVLCIVLTRFVSLGSLVGCVIFPLFCIAKYMDVPFSYETLIIIPAAFLGILGIIRHKNNINKLVSGTENKIGDKSKK